MKVVIFDLDDTLLCSKTNALYNNVKELLWTLKSKGCLLALASYNCSARQLLAEHDISHLFDIIVTENWQIYLDYKFDMLNYILKTVQNHKNKITKSEVLFVDDNHRNIMVATDIGIKTCLVKQGKTAEIVLEQIA